MKTNYKYILVIFLFIGFASCTDPQAYKDGQYWAEEICKMAEFEINGGIKPDDFPVDKRLIRIKEYTDFCLPEFNDFVRGFEDYTKECPHQNYLNNQLRLMTEKCEEELY
jgi:hypothetical protein